MGFTGLARWVNAPQSGVELIQDNILVNHRGRIIGKWQLTIRSYRSSLSQIPALNIPSERTMCALTMRENVFVLLEDPLAPTRGDIIELPPSPAPQGHHSQSHSSSHVPSHYRTTFLTLKPPGALEQLLAHLQARWTSVRQSGSTAARGHAAQGQQILVDGFSFTIGNDWVVRIGNVILPGSLVKGMLLEAEYLPLPVLHSPIADGTSELLSNLLTSILPNIKEAKTVAVTISDSQWEDVLWDREEEEKETNAAKEEGRKDDDDIYAYGEEYVSAPRKGDWSGVDRDRRSAFLIMGALRSEGIL